jgi:hypothetical protein
MFENWYVMYCLMQARQRELLKEAAMARAATSPETASRIHGPRWPRGVLIRLGRLLVRWGTALQERHAG